MLANCRGLRRDSSASPGRAHPFYFLAATAQSRRNGLLPYVGAAVGLSCCVYTLYTHQPNEIPPSRENAGACAAAPCAPRIEQVINTAWV